MKIYCRYPISSLDIVKGDLGTKLRYAENHVMKREIQYKTQKPTPSVQRRTVG